MLKAFFSVIFIFILLPLYFQNSESGREQVWRHNEGEPPPTGCLATVSLFQTVHGLRAKHHGVTGSEGDVLGETVSGLHIDAMTQGAIEVLEVCRYG